MEEKHPNENNDLNSEMQSHSAASAAGKEASNTVKIDIEESHHETANQESEEEDAEPIKSTSADHTNIRIDAEEPSSDEDNDESAGSNSTDQTTTDSEASSAEQSEDESSGSDTSIATNDGRMDATPGRASTMPTGPPPYYTAERTKWKDIRLDDSEDGESLPPTYELALTQPTVYYRPSIEGKPPRSVFTWNKSRRPLITGAGSTSEQNCPFHRIDSSDSGGIRIVLQRNLPYLGSNPENQPTSYIWLSLITLFINPPIGAVAIILSICCLLSSSRQAGKLCGSAALILNLVGYIMAIIVVTTSIPHRRQALPAYDSAHNDSVFVSAPHP